MDKEGPDEAQQPLPRTPVADTEPPSPYDATDDVAENDGSTEPIPETLSPIYDASSSSGNLDDGGDDDDDDPYTDVSSMSSDAAASLAELEVRRRASLSCHGDRPLDASNRSSASVDLRLQGSRTPPVGLSFSRSGSQGSGEKPPPPPQVMQEPGSPVSHHRRQHSFALRFYDSEDDGSRAGSLVFVENSPARGMGMGASPSMEGNRARTGSAGSVGQHSTSRQLSTPVPLTRVRSSDRVLSSGERMSPRGAFPRFYDSEDEGPGSLVFTPSNEGGAQQHGHSGHQLSPRIQRSFSLDDGQPGAPSNSTSKPPREAQLHTMPYQARKRLSSLRQEVGPPPLMPGAVTEGHQQVRPPLPRGSMGQPPPPTGTQQPPGGGNGSGGGGQQDLSRYKVPAIPPFKGESDTSDNSPPEETANKGGTLRKVKSATTPTRKKPRGGSDASPESSPEKRIRGRGGDGGGGTDERSRRKKRPPLAQRGASAERGEAREVIDPPQQLTVPPSPKGGYHIRINSQGSVSSLGSNAATDSEYQQREYRNQARLAARQQRQDQQQAKQQQQQQQQYDEQFVAQQQMGVGSDRRTMQQLGMAPPIGGGENYDYGGHQSQRQNVLSRDSGRQSAPGDHFTNILAQEINQFIRDEQIATAASSGNLQQFMPPPPHQGYGAYQPPPGPQQWGGAAFGGYYGHGQQPYPGGHQPQHQGYGAPLPPGYQPSMLQQWNGGGQEEDYGQYGGEYDRQHQDQMMMYHQQMMQRQHYNRVMAQQQYHAPQHHTQAPGPPSRYYDPQQDAYYQHEQQQYQQGGDRRDRNNNNRRSGEYGERTSLLSPGHQYGEYASYTPRGQQPSGRPSTESSSKRRKSRRRSRRTKERQRQLQYSSDTSDEGGESDGRRSSVGRSRRSRGSGTKRRVKRSGFGQLQGMNDDSVSETYSVSFTSDSLVGEKGKRSLQGNIFQRLWLFLNLLVANVPLSFSAISFSIVLLGILTKAYTQEVLMTCQQVKFHTSQCLFPQFPGCYFCDEYNLWYQTAVAVDNGCSYIGGVSVFVFFLKALVSWRTFIDEMSSPVTTSPAGLIFMTMVLSFAGKCGTLGAVLVFVASGLHLVLAIWFIYMSLAYQIIPDPGWFPNTIGIGLCAVKVWFYYPLLGHFLIAITLMLSIMYFPISLIRVALNEKMSATICWMNMIGPSISLYALAIIMQPTFQQERPDVSHFQMMQRSVYLPSMTFLFGMSIIGMVSSVHGISIRGGQIAREEFSPAHAAYSFPLLLHALAVQSYRNSLDFFMDAGSERPALKTALTALHIYWLFLFVIGSFVAVTCIITYLVLLPSWVDIDTRDEIDEPPPPSETSISISNNVTYGESLIQPYISPTILQANETGTLILTYDYQNNWPDIVRTRKTSAFGFEPALGKRVFNRERKALKQYLGGQEVIQECDEEEGDLFDDEVDT
mmetsp:Transcript_9548/g.20593  ORF Transcript_9548/g.20593 Transcript_9548/m.20593 type:complete len:1435 (-) Transcript_9548:31-4335(-)